MPVETAAGYLSPGYAASLAEFGEPRLLPESGGSLLVREIAGSGLRDAMGCYPLLACADWRALPRDLEAAAPDLVSLTAVADPFGDYDEALLRESFQRVSVFKQHFVTDLSRDPASIATKHHRYYTRRALEAVEVERCDDPAAHLDEWVALYGTLKERHEITGIRAFSRTAFERQLALPGMEMLLARSGGEVVGAHLWYLQGEVAYSHLAAVSPRGYTLNAAYALYWFALHWFAPRAAWLDVGTGAGASADADDGLTRFKRGWSTGVRPVYLCGRVFDEAAYHALARERAPAGTAYFPAYRAGEFGR